MKKPRIAFSIADDNNLKYAHMLEKSLRKFHSEEALPLHIVQGDELKSYLKDDPHFFYRAKPTIARKFMADYECVIGMDADQLVLGDLSYLWEANDFQVGTVLNINRVDPQKYGLISVGNIPPQKYFNAGLVVMKDDNFVEDWYDKCNGPMFQYMQMREQDLLNLICYFGDYKVRCLDYYDMPRNSYCWWGAVFKGEESKAILKDGKIILPKGKDGYPDRDIEVKLWHTPGPDHPKLNYRTKFSAEVVDYIDTLVK